MYIGTLYIMLHPWACWLKPGEVRHAWGYSVSALHECSLLTIHSHITHILPSDRVPSPIRIQPLRNAPFPAFIAMDAPGRGRSSDRAPSW